MTTYSNLIAIYDFEFFPYALGDVLTWNVRTAMRCEEMGRQFADVYICADENYPASIYQRGLVNPENFELFFSELYGAFGTNPRLGNIFIFRKREDMLAQLQKVAADDAVNLEALQDYLNILKNRVSDSILSKIYHRIERKVRSSSLMRRLYDKFTRIAPESVREMVCDNLSQEHLLNKYFIKYVYSHEAINAYWDKHGKIPYLTYSLGCVPDVDEIIARRFKGKKIVPFHLRLRRLDVGYGGDHSYPRDSDFLEWYDFLREAGDKYPDVQFVALGRLQEKPLEILRLPNVTSLRVFGMGLGHELTLMLKSDLFIGTSSGFAALANFSALPYYITKMNQGSCDAYAIPSGADRLPFANDNQRLVYEQETSALLMSLLKAGLKLEDKPKHVANPSAPEGQAINISDWLKLHSDPTSPARTTCRFYADEKYRHEETAYLLVPYLDRIRQALDEKNVDKAKHMLHRLERHFSDLCKQYEPFLMLQKNITEYEGSEVI